MNRLTKNPNYKKSPFIEKSFNDNIQLSLAEISEIFRNRYLLEKESFFVIDKETKTIDSSIYLADYKLEALALKNKLLDGNVISIKNLENLNTKIEDACKVFSDNTSLHMYITPTNGESFNMHKDDRHVFIRVLYGTKIIICKEGDRDVAYTLDSGDWMHIPFGIEHRAVNCSPAISISFGIVESESKYVNLGIEEIDLKRMLGVE